VVALVTQLSFIEILFEANAVCVLPPSIKESLKNVSEAVDSRQKSERKQSFYVINEHFEPIFNAEMTTQVVFQRFPGKIFRLFMFPSIWVPRINPEIIFNLINPS